MICDDTMREGLQAPGMSMKTEEKLKLAKLLSESGVKTALVSYPSAHSSEFEVTKKIVEMGYFKETFALGRTVEKDIDVIADTGADIALHLPFRFDDTSAIIRAVKYASKKGRLLEVAVVDVTKYKEDILLKLCGEIMNAGANVIQLPDTTGMATPERFRSVVSNVRNEFRDVEIEIHCHNDAGLSTANAIAGLQAGADRVDTTVYGIGERNGITDQMSMVSYLESVGKGAGIDLKKLTSVYEYVLGLIQEKTGPDFFESNYPIVGKNARIHTAGTHAAFSDLFHGGEFSLNVYAGRNMIRKILESAGLSVSDQHLSSIVNKVKDLAVDSGHALRAKDIIQIAGEIRG